MCLSTVDQPSLTSGYVGDKDGLGNIPLIATRTLWIVESAVILDNTGYIGPMVDVAHGDGHGRVIFLIEWVSRMGT